jgi:hypothetical protein
MDKEYLEDLIMYATTLMRLKTSCAQAKENGKSGEFIYHNVVVPIFKQFDRDFSERRVNALLEMKG